jgi:YaiO family outer membrane protein
MRSGGFGVVLAAVAVVAAPSILDAQDEFELRRPSQYRVDAGYQLTVFDKDADPWHYVSTWVERREPRYSLIGRVNYAHRFQESSWQFEADAYPLFSRRFYAYLNLGYSPSEAFPKWRAGGELFANLPKAWEASAGFRYLLFDNDEVGMLSGSVGKYYGNYWTSLRPYAVLDDGTVSWSLMLMTRKYYVDADNYVGFMVSYGDAPDERISEIELDRLSNFMIGIGGKHPLNKALSWGWLLQYQWEELTNNRSRNRIGAGLTFESRL